MKKWIVFFLCFFTVFGCTFSQKFIPYRSGSLYGLLNERLAVVQKSIYDSLTPVPGTDYFIARIKIANVGYRYYILKQNIVVFTIGSMIRHIYGDYFCYQAERNSILINVNTKETFSATSFLTTGEPMIPVRQISSEVSYSYMDLKGNKLFGDLKFKRTYGFYENHAVCLMPDWSYVILDTDGNLLQNENFLSLGQRFSEGLIAVLFQDGSTGYIDYAGSVRIKMPICVQENVVAATDFKGGYAFVQISENPPAWVSINTKGEICSAQAINVDSMDTFSCGFSLAYKKDIAVKKTYYGYYDKKGCLLLNTFFDFGSQFYNDYAIINLHGRDGILHASGKIIWIDEL
nr:hypothetical protein [Treponema socranskii]